MERSIRVREMTRVIQIYYIKRVNFHAGGGDASPPSPPGAIPEVLPSCVLTDLP